MLCTEGTHPENGECVSDGANDSDADADADAETVFCASRETGAP
jgi:hypothetical protein